MNDELKEKMQKAAKEYAFKEMNFTKQLFHSVAEECKTQMRRMVRLPK